MAHKGGRASTLKAEGTLQRTEHKLGNDAPHGEM